MEIGLQEGSHASNLGGKRKSALEYHEKKRKELSPPLGGRWGTGRAALIDAAVKKL